VSGATDRGAAEEEQLSNLETAPALAAEATRISRGAVLERAASASAPAAWSRSFGGEAREGEQEERKDEQVLLKTAREGEEKETEERPPLLPAAVNKEGEAEFEKKAPLLLAAESGEEEPEGAELEKKPPLLLAAESGEEEPEGAEFEKKAPLLPLVTTEEGGEE